IEPFLPVDAPAPDPEGPEVHWHPMVLPQRSALDGNGAAADDRRQLRELGFLAAAIAPTGGVFKGTGAVVLLDDPPVGRRAGVEAERCSPLGGRQRRFAGGGPDRGRGAIARRPQPLSAAGGFAGCRGWGAQNPERRPPLPPGGRAREALADQRDLPI